MGRIGVTIVQRHLHEGNRTWYARVRDFSSGKVRYVSLKTTKKAEARMFADDMLRAGEFDSVDSTEAITFRRGIEMFERHLRAKGTSESSISTYERTFFCFPEFLDRKVSGIGREELFRAFDCRFAGLAPSTYNNARAALRALYNYFVDILEALPKNPVRRMPKKKAPFRERKFWTMEQVERILRAAPDQTLRLLWAFMAYEGLRIHEALKVVPEDIRDGKLHVIGKGSKYAAIPLSPPMRSELERAGWEWDFGGITRQNEIFKLRIAVRKALGGENDGEATNHRFRHSFASNLIRAGANVKVVQKLMRHATVQMTLNAYAHLLGDDLESGIGLLTMDK